MRGRIPGWKPLFIDGYLVREFLGPFVGSVVGFTIILLSGLLFELTDLILVKKVEAGTVVRMLLYKLPGLAIVSLPIGVLFATLLGLGRLVKDGEMTALRSSGLSFRRLVAPFLAMALGVSALTVWANERIVPWANHQFENLVRASVFRDPLPTVEERVFFRDGHGTVFYVREVDHRAQTLHDVMIYETENRQDAFPRIITAKRGRFEDALWHLEDVVTRTLDDEGYVENELRAPSLLYPLTERTQDFFGTQKTTDEMTRRELRDHIELFNRSGIELRAFVVDYHLKLALPLASFIFALAGAPLSLRSARSGRFFGISVSLLLSFLYFILTSVSRSLGINGVLPPLVAAWLPTLLFVGLGVYLIGRADASLTPGLYRRWAGRSRAALMIGMALFALLMSIPGSVTAQSRHVTVEAEEYGLWQADERTFWAEGNVRVVDGEVSIRSDNMTYDMDAEEIQFTGNVVYLTPEGELRGTTLRYEVATQRGWIDDVEAEYRPDLAADPIYLFGDGIERDPERIVVTKARLTTCKVGEPPYHFAANTVEIIPGDRIIIHGARFVEHGITLAYWPRLTISLREDKSRFDAPRFGYNDTDGWYVKWTHNYFGFGDDYGFLYLDYYQRRGFGVGSRYVYQDTPRYQGDVYAYTVEHPEAGRDYEFEWNQRWRLSGGTDIMAKLGYERLAAGTPQVEEKKKAEGRIYTPLARGLVDMDGRFLEETSTGTDRLELDGTGRLLYRLGNGWDFSLRGSAFRDVREYDTGSRDVGRYTYLARLEKRWNQTSLLIDAEQLIHPTLIKLKRGEKEEEADFDWRSVHRLPEVTLSTNQRLLGLPFTLRASAGHFRQYGAKPVPGADPYTEDTRFMTSAQLRGYTLRVTPNTHVTARGSVTSHYYGEGTDEGRWQLGFESRVSLNYRPTRSLRLSADYDYRQGWGSTPFAFDKISPLEAITPRAQWNSGPWSLLATSRYDLRNETWGNLVNQVVYRKPNLDVRLYGTYRIPEKQWGDLVTTVQWSSTDDYRLRLGAWYSVEDRQLTQLDIDGTVPIGKTWSFGTRMIYDLTEEKFSSAYFRLTKDLACREISLSYDHMDKEIWLEYQIFAFPMSRVKVGRMEEDATFLFESDLLKELLDE